MGDPRGFIKIRAREENSLREASDRVCDYLDTHNPQQRSEQIEQIGRQSSRCMDCGVPFCHFSCPLGNLIPEWNDLVYNGRWRDAYNRLQSTNNFPEFTGRVCPALCEKGCVLGSVDPSVTIENVERTISDVAFNREYVDAYSADYSTGYTVAIVGSGPAGLAAAQQLVRAGHTVAVYEKDDKPGGLLRYGIPNFKLEKRIIDRRLSQLESEGVRFRCNVEVGGNGENDVSWTYLRERFDVVLIAIGTGIPNDLPIPGRELNNIYFAMDYLTASTKAVFNENVSEQRLTSEIMPEINANGKNVLIIGGGDTGSDCLGTALRQGAKHVTTLQVMPEPGSKRDSVAFYGEQPWPTYPMLNTQSTSIQEGYALGKSDVLYETTVTELKGNTAGEVTSAVIASVKWENGSFTVQEDTKREIPVDLVLISIGFKGANVSSLTAELDLAVDDRGKILRGDDFSTNVPNVFVCGDAGRGQSLVVWAIAEGRSAASTIDRALTGVTELPQPITPNSAPLRG